MPKNKSAVERYMIIYSMLRHLNRVKTSEILNESINRGINTLCVALALWFGLSRAFEAELIVEFTLFF